MSGWCRTSSSRRRHLRVLHSKAARGHCTNPSFWLPSVCESWFHCKTLRLGLLFPLTTLVLLGLKLLWKGDGRPESSVLHRASSCGIDVSGKSKSSSGFASPFALGMAVNDPILEKRVIRLSTRRRILTIWFESEMFDPPVGTRKVRQKLKCKYESPHQISEDMAVSMEDLQWDSKSTQSHGPSVAQKLLFLQQKMHSLYWHSKSMSRLPSTESQVCVIRRNAM